MLANFVELRYGEVQHSPTPIGQDRRRSGEGFLLAGGDVKDWPSQEKQIRTELVQDEAKAAAEAAHAEAFGRMKGGF
jgi:hypothetical protein